MYKWVNWLLYHRRNCIVVQRLGRYYVRRYKHEPPLGMNYREALRERKKRIRFVGGEG